MATLESAKKLAEASGCSLDAVYTGAAGGWMIALDAPEGMVFTHSGCSVDLDIYGNGNCNEGVDWEKTEESIRAAVAHGFDRDEEF